jgi:hypothetical protein
MFRKTLLLLFISLLVGSTDAAIDLTPSVREFLEDGVASREVSFKTPEGKMLLDLVPGWTIRGQKDRAQITGTNASADAVIEAIALQKPEPLDEAAIAKFKQQVVAALPVGSTKVTVIQEGQNTLTPGGNPSFEMVITYDLWGKILQRSVFLVNGPQDRLIFRFTSLKQDFSGLETQFRRMITTWRAVAAKQAPKPAVAQAEAALSQAN